MKHFQTLILFAVILSACRLADRRETPDTAVTLPAAAGPEIEPGNYLLSLGDQTGQRNVIVHIPPAYDGGAKLPLLIVLHGGGQNAEGIQRLSEMDGDADEYGFVVAYPDGSGRLEDRVLTWNAGHCCEYAMEQGVDDVAFLGLLIDSMVSHYSIDSDRIYITGISNGGMMAYRAGAELADKVAAIAPIAATVGGRSPDSSVDVVIPAPAAPVAVIAFHGMQDHNVPYEGGIGPAALSVGRYDLPVETSVVFWVQANGCDSQPATETQAAGNIIVDTYSGCDADASVVLVTIVDGGHAWPGAQRGLVSDPPTQDISANEMMLEFFLAHPKPGS
ncbi:MAG: PHB depolymerase family esterase [Anaerolineales bacterium]